MLDLPPGRLGVFTTAEARDAGLTRSALAHAQRHGRAVQLHRGVWAAPVDASDPGHRAQAIAQQTVAGCLSATGAVASHLAAATLEDLPTWARYPRACVTVVGRSRVALAGLHVHRTGRGFDGRLVGDVVVTNVRRTVVDIAREFGAESGLVTADAAVRRGLTTAAELVAASRSLRGAGAADAKRVAALVDPRAESPLESRSRWQFEVHDIGQPRPQTDVFTTGGQFLGRVDFFWEEGVVGEVDGSVKYRDDGEARVREKWRQELLERTGLLIVRWGAKDLLDFQETAARIRDRRARALRPGWPRDWAVPPEV